MNSRIVAVLRKEIREILRDPYTLSIALALPLVMLFLFAYGVNTDVRNIQLVILDFDQSAASREYSRAFTNSGYFRLVASVGNYDEIADLLDRDVAEVALAIVREKERVLFNRYSSRRFARLNSSSAS